MKENETNEDQKQEPIADLEISSEQATEVEGGATFPIQPYEGFQGGVRVAR